MRLVSPAKCNLFLAVLKKRQDGFHEVFSLMQAISLCDFVTVTLSKVDRFSCSCSDIPIDHRNFVFQARDVFRKKTGYSHPLQIHIQKNIPHQSGLGGGSSNVATALYAMNQLSGLNIPELHLSQWAATISADAPFFFSTGHAQVRGFGDVVTSSPTPLVRKLYVAMPVGINVSTAHAFQHMSKDLFSDRLYSDRSLGDNDLELVVLKLKPALKTIKDRLLALGFEKVFLTGSGSAFICLGDVVDPSMHGVRFIRSESVFRSKGWY